MTFDTEVSLAHMYDTTKGQALLDYIRDKFGNKQFDEHECELFTDPTFRESLNDATVDHMASLWNEMNLLVASIARAAAAKYTKPNENHEVERFAFIILHELTARHLMINFADNIVDRTVITGSVSPTSEWVKRAASLAMSGDEYRAAVTQATASTKAVMLNVMHRYAHHVHEKL